MNFPPTSNDPGLVVNQIGVGNGPAFQNGVTNFGGGFVPAYFAAVGPLVVVEAVVNLPANLPAGSTWFILSAGFRPITNRVIVGWDAQNNVAVRVDILPSGAVQNHVVLPAGGGIHCFATTFDPAL